MRHYNEYQLLYYVLYETQYIFNDVYRIIIIEKTSWFLYFPIIDVYVTRNYIHYKPL